MDFFPYRDLGFPMFSEAVDQPQDSDFPFSNRISPDFLRISQFSLEISLGGSPFFKRFPWVGCRMMMMVMSKFLVMQAAMLMMMMMMMMMMMIEHDYG